MIRIQKRLFALLAAIMLLAPSQAFAQKPMLVISISSVEELAEDAGYLLQAAEIPGLDQQIPVLIQTFGQGLDVKKPIGAVVRAKGIGIEAIAFIPVTNFEIAMALVEASLGPAQDAGDGVLQLQTPLAPIFLKESGGYAYVAQSKEQLVQLPANPVTLLGGLEKRYDFAIQANIQAIPELYRNLVESQLKTGVELGLQPLPGESDEQYEIRRQVTQAQVDQFITILTELDSLTIGASIDRTAKNIHFDMEMTALEGTSLARQSANLTPMETAFSGFLPDNAILSMNVTQKVAAEEVQQVKLMLDLAQKNVVAELDNDLGLEDLQRDALTSMVDDLFSVVIDTLQDGAIDGAASVSANGSTVLMLGGFKVANGQKLDVAFKQLVDLAKDETEVPPIKLNVDEHKGVTFHTVSVPLPEFPAEPQKIFGPNLEIAIGLGDNGVYVGMGQNCLSAIKSAMDTSAEGKIVPPLKMSVSLVKALQFASTVVDFPPEQQGLIDKLLALQGNDKISITMEGIPSGQRVRLQVDEAVIKALGISVSSLIAVGQAPAF